MQRPPARQHSPPREYLPPHWTVPLPLPGALQEWRPITTQWSANYRWSGASTSSGIVAVVIVDLMKILPDYWSSSVPCANHPTTVDSMLAALREAIELCHLYWQLHPPQVREKLKDKSPAIVEDIDHSGRCVDVVGVEFELQVSGPDMRLLGDLIAPMLVSAPSSVLYRRTRDQLTALFTTHKKPSRPIPIILNAKLQENPGMITNWHVERFFGDIAAFAAYFTRVHAGGLHEIFSATFHLNRIYISVDAIPITTWVVQRVLELVNVQDNLVTFTKFTLDPRMLACGDDDARRLVLAVTEASPQVLLSVGDLPSQHPTHEEEEQREEVPLDRLVDLIHSVRGAIASATSIGSLDLSLLLLLLPTRHKRKIVWKALTGCLSRPMPFPMEAEQPLEEFIINAPIKLDNDDAKMIRWERQRNGKQRRSVKSVSIDVEECSDSSVLELASLFGGLEYLSISRHHATFTAPLLLRLVKRAPNLHSIGLDHLKIDCAATVNELAQAVPWQSLSVTDVEVSDASVVFNFLRDLSDPSCHLAKSLRVLRLSSRNNSTAVCNTAVLLLAKALRTNQVLQELHITVQNNVSSAAIAAVRCHHGNLLCQPQPRERAAFLSIVNHIPDGHPLQRIDNNIATTVFSFSARQLLRRVTVKLAPLLPHPAADDTQ